MSGTGRGERRSNRENLISCPVETEIKNVPVRFVYPAQWYFIPLFVMENDSGTNKREGQRQNERNAT